MKNSTASEYNVYLTQFNSLADGFRYYEYIGNLKEEQFDLLVRQSCAASHYDTGIVPKHGDQILMLSTCSYHTENGRFVVAARRKREIPDKNE
ncbi:MAG: class B sortase [Brotaphodocola sp.]